MKAPDEDSAVRRGVMLRQVELRRKAEAGLVKNLSAPEPEELNGGPCLCAFLDRLDPASRKAGANDLIAFAREEQMRKNERRYWGIQTQQQDRREIACYAAVAPGGAVGAIRALCNL